MTNTMTAEEETGPFDYRVCFGSAMDSEAYVYVYVYVYVCIYVYIYMYM